jgi:hypothetical protein
VPADEILTGIYRQAGKQLKTTQLRGITLVFPDAVSQMSCLIRRFNIREPSQGEKSAENKGFHTLRRGWAIFLTQNEMPEYLPNILKQLRHLGALHTVTT